MEDNKVVKIGERREVMSNVTHIDNERTQVVLDYLRDVIKETYSPYGSTVMIGDTATKDGINTLNTLALVDMDDAVILSFVKSVCSKALFTGGDNTTTSVILTAELFRTINGLWEQRKELGLETSRAFTGCLKEAIRDVIAELKMGSKKNISLEDVINVVSVSLNHDERHVNVFKDLYKEAEVLGIRHDKLAIYPRRAYGSTDISFTITNGYNIDYPADGVGNIQSDNVTLPDVKIIPYATKLESPEDYKYLQTVVSAVAKTNTPTLFICTEMREAFKDIIKSTISKHYQTTGQMIPIYFLYSEALDNTVMDAESFSDLFAYLGVTPIYKSDKDDFVFSENDYRFMPSATVKFWKNKTEFIDIKACTDKLLNDRLRELENLVNHAQDTFEKNRLQGRIDRLTSSVGIIHVASETEQDTKRVVDAFDDACAVLNSALKTGIVPGSNFAVPQAIMRLNNKTKAGNPKEKMWNAISRAYLNIVHLIWDMADVSKEMQNKVMIDITEEHKEFDTSLITFDVVKKVLSNKIVHSVELESRVLSAAGEIVSILVTSSLMILENVYDKNKYVDKLK